MPKEAKRHSKFPTPYYSKPHSKLPSSYFYRHFETPSHKYNNQTPRYRSRSDSIHNRRFSRYKSRSQSRSNSRSHKYHINFPTTILHTMIVMALGMIKTIKNILQDHIILLAQTITQHPLVAH